MMTPKNNNSRVLDTMTLSYLMKGEETAVKRLTSCKRSSIYLPQPVVAEIAFGLDRMTNSKRKKSLQSRFQLLLSQLRRADWSDEVSLRFGSIKALLESQGQPLEDFDIAIAAHALGQGSILVTDNLRHMARIPDLRTESWASEVPQDAEA